MALAALVFGCVQPEQEAAKVISTSPVALNNVAAAGGTFNLDVVTNANWTATADSWISVNPSSGTVTGIFSKMSVSVTVEANEDAEAREGKIVFSIDGSSASVPVIQAGKNDTPDTPVDPPGPEDEEFNGVIKNAAQMKAFLEVAATIEAGTEVPIEADIDMKDVQFTSPFEFHGILNGKNHTVKNISSSTSLILQNYGTIKDLTLEGEFAVEASGPTFIAAVTNINYGTIQNVTNKASVTLKGADPQGVGVAGIACESYGPLVNCTNTGAITLDAAGTSVYGAPVAGIVCILGSSATSCTNSGPVSLTADYIAGKSALGQIAMKYNKTPQVAGIAAYAVKDADHDVSVTGCNNSGKISLTFTKCDNMPETMAETPGRIGIAGIVAATGGDITDCNNTGEINVSAKSSNGQTVAVQTTSLILNTSGIAGHEYFATYPSSQNVTNVRNCNNSGNIFVDSDNSYANSTVGGIYAWPGVEGTQDKVVENCVNSGNITINGLCKIRVGGVNGGSGHIISCKNKGNITVENSMETSVFGLLTGFSTRSHRTENCETSGTITTKVKVNGISGLIGAIGNYAIQTGEGCKVNAVLNGSADTPNSGLVVGYFNGKTKSIVLGSYTSPIQVQGSVNGTTITKDNFESYLTSPEGTPGTSYTPTIHTIIAQFGEGGQDTPGGDDDDKPQYTYPQLASFNGKPVSELTAGEDYVMVWPDAWLKSDNGAAKLSMNRPEYNGVARQAPGKLAYQCDESGSWAVPYIVCQGLIVGDYWLFEIPIKDLPAGKVTFKGAGGCSTASVKFWLMEFSVDGQNTWTAIEPKTTSTTAAGTAIGREVTYTFEYPKASKEANNVFTPLEYSFANPAVSGESVLYIRIMACDLLRGDETGDITKAENGGGSRLGDVITITHSTN